MTTEKTARNLEIARTAVDGLHLNRFVHESLTTQQLAEDIETLASLVLRLADEADEAVRILSAMKLGVVGRSSVPATPRGRR
jgi:hypothetical protein